MLTRGAAERACLVGFCRGCGLYSALNSEQVPIQQGTTHFYWLHVGEYDVVRIHFARQGNNLTASTNDPGCPGCVQSNGHGLIGVLRFDVDKCPSGGNARQEHPLGNGITLTLTLTLT